MAKETGVFVLCRESKEVIVGDLQVQVQVQTQAELPHCIYCNRPVQSIPFLASSILHLRYGCSWAGSMLSANSRRWRGMG